MSLHEAASAMGTRSAKARREAFEKKEGGVKEYHLYMQELGRRGGLKKAKNARKAKKAQPTKTEDRHGEA